MRTDNDNGASGSNANIWPDAKIEQLRKLRAEGLSFRQLATVMGISTNAAISKAKRLGMLVDAKVITLSRANANNARRAADARTENARKRRMEKQHLSNEEVKLRQRLEREAALAKVEPSAEPGIVRVFDVLDLEPQHCRWPLPTTGATRWGFCGDTAGWGISYCLVHYAQSRHVPLKCVGVKAPEFPKREAAE